MSSSIINAESILAIELGSVNTRAVLLDVVEGHYRFIAVGEGPNTANAPFHNVLTGVHQAVRELQQITGRLILNSEGGLVIPSQFDGSGVDRLVLTFSTGPELKFVVAGLLEEVTLESAERLAYTTYGRVMEVIGLNDPRRREAQLDAVLRAQPNLIILAGGVDEGASRSVLRVAELALLSYRILPANRRPEVLFAGNRALEKKIKDGLQKYAVVHTAPNIRPAIDAEALGPAQEVLAGVVTQMRLRQMNGLQDLSVQCATPPLPAANAFGRMITFLSQIYEPGCGIQFNGPGGSRSWKAGFERVPLRCRRWCRARGSTEPVGRICPMAADAHTIGCCSRLHCPKTALSCQHSHEPGNAGAGAGARPTGDESGNAANAEALAEHASLLRAYSGKRCCASPCAYACPEPVDDPGWFTAKRDHDGGYGSKWAVIHTGCGGKIQFSFAGAGAGVRRISKPGLGDFADQRCAIWHTHPARSP